MSDYKEVVGTGVLNYAGDIPNVLVGQLWYNSTAKDFRLSKTAEVGSWSTGGNLNTARGLLAGAGTQTAALAFGGWNGGTFYAVTEAYNGSSWTEVNDLNQARRGPGGAGTSTAALAFGGHTPPAVVSTEIWNGTNWTEVNNLGTARYGVGNAGTSTAALAYGGAGGYKSETEIWNGTNWTEVNDLNVGGKFAGSGGTTTSALMYGGQKEDVSNPSDAALTESWNGTNWTEVADLNQSRIRMSGVAADNTAALGFGGERNPGGVSAQTESWDGTSWTEVNDLNTARYLGSGAGTNTAGLYFGATDPSPARNLTEEWNVAPAQITQTITS